MSRINLIHQLDLQHQSNSLLKAILVILKLKIFKFNPLLQAMLSKITISFLTIFKIVFKMLHNLFRVIMYSNKVNKIQHLQIMQIIINS